MQGELALYRPTQAMKAQAEQYVAEHLAHGERELHGGALLEQMPYEAWLRGVKSSERGHPAHAGWVASSTFFAVRPSDGQLVGMVDIRHQLNALLASYGGHIGYGVRPSERGKGYAVAILQMALARARSTSLTRVMLCCNATNEASRRTILRCGGVREKTFVHSDGNAVEVYWIDLQERYSLKSHEKSNLCVNRADCISSAQRGK